jgi:hypothetical protein
VLAVVLVLLVALAAAYGLREQGEIVRDAYCVDWASASIERYIDDNGGNYPTDWQSLRPSFDKVTDISFTFEEVQARTSINFEIAPQNPSQQFVTLASGRGVHWGETDPNDRIRERLQKHGP